jgi:hypothetical protein
MTLHPESPDRIKEVTHQLEHGDNHGLISLLSGKFEEERIAALNLIRDQNGRDRQADPNAKQLDIQTTGGVLSNSEYVRLLSGGLADWNGGQTVFTSSLDLTTLTRSGSDPGSAPANRTFVNVRALTDALERGDGAAAAGLVSPLYEEERFRAFRQAGKLNEDDLAAHRTNVSLAITTGGTKMQTDEIRVERDLAGLHDAFLGGVTIYNDSLNLDTLKRDVRTARDTRT